jgi:translation initiation factor 1 (eIF-1/SUI1)
MITLIKALKCLEKEMFVGGHVETKIYARKSKLTTWQIQLQGQNNQRIGHLLH